MYSQSPVGTYLGRYLTLRAGPPPQLFLSASFPTTIAGLEGREKFAGADTYILTYSVQVHNEYLLSFIPLCHELTLRSPLRAPKLFARLSFCPSLPPMRSSLTFGTADSLAPFPARAPPHGTAELRRTDGVLGPFLWLLAHTYNTVSLLVTPVRRELTILIVSIAIHLVQVIHSAQVWKC